MTDVTPDSEETKHLLQQVRQGRPGFDRLFDRHRIALRRAVDLRLDQQLRARVDPSDVVQETQMEAFRRLSDYLNRRPMPFHLWLRKTAYEQLIMIRRRHMHRLRRAVERELPLPNQSSVSLGRYLAAPGKSPSQQATEEELGRRVRLAIGQLDEADRNILLMRNYEGLSYHEIACILEIEPAAARKRNGRALVRLHKLLTESGLTESQL